MISCGGRFRSWRRAFLVGKALPRRRVLPAEGFGRGGELRAGREFAPAESSLAGKAPLRGELRAAKSFAPRSAPPAGHEAPALVRGVPTARSGSAKSGSARSRPARSRAARSGPARSPAVRSGPARSGPARCRLLHSHLDRGTHHHGMAAACAAGGGCSGHDGGHPPSGRARKASSPEPTRRACPPCTMALPSRCARQSPHVPLPLVGPLPTAGPTESACRQVGRHIAEHRETRLTPDRSSAAAVSDRSAAAPDPASDQDGRCSRT